MSFIDHFDGASLDPRWTAVTAGAGAVTVTDSYAKLDAPANADVAFLYIAIDKSVSQSWTFRYNPVTTNLRRYFWLLNRTSAPVGAAFSTFEADARIAVGMSSGPLKTQFTYWSTSHTRTHWSTSGNAWNTTASSSALSQSAFDDYVEVTLEIDGPGARFRLIGVQRDSTNYSYEQGYRIFALTDWVNWSSLESTADTLYLVWGKPFTDANPGEARLELVRHADDAKQHAWVNGKPNLGGTYNIKHHHSYDGLLWIPQDRTTIAVQGTAGQWDSGGVKDPWVEGPINGVYYMFYDNVASIGLATATSPDGPWTKDAGNPILAATSGDESAVFFPCARFDPDESDANRKWKMLYAGFNGSTTKWRLFYATAPDAGGGAPGGWTRHGLVYDAGAASSWNEDGNSGPIFDWIGGQWEVLFTGTRVDTRRKWRVGRLFGSDLLNLTAATNPLLDHADASESLTANLSHRTASVASTTGFVKDQMVLLDQDSNADNFGLSRVRKVNAGTSLELYHALDGFTTAAPAKVIGWDEGAMHPRALRRIGSTWCLWITSFQITRGQPATYEAFMESVALLTHTGATLGGGTFAFDWLNTPGLLLTSWHHLRSSENIALLSAPIARAGTDTGALTASASAVAGSGQLLIQGAASLASSGSALSGQGNDVVTAAGALTASASTLSGQGTEVLGGTGGLTGSGSSTSAQGEEIIEGSGGLTS
jgi:hypothetical protein